MGYQRRVHGEFQIGRPEPNVIIITLSQLFFGKNRQQS